MFTRLILYFLHFILYKRAAQAPGPAAAAAQPGAHYVFQRRPMATDNTHGEKLGAKGKRNNHQKRGTHTHTIEPKGKKKIIKIKEIKEKDMGTWRDDRFFLLLCVLCIAAVQTESTSAIFL